MTQIENLKHQIVSNPNMPNAVLRNVCEEIIALIQEESEAEARAKVKVGLNFVNRGQVEVYRIYKIEGDTVHINWESDKIGVTYRIDTVAHNLSSCWREII